MKIAVCVHANVVTKNEPAVGLGLPDTKLPEAQDEL
jgi:hypothetical protein